MFIYAVFSSIVVKESIFKDFNIPMRYIIQTDRSYRFELRNCTFINIQESYIQKSIEEINIILFDEILVRNSLSTNLFAFLNSPGVVISNIDVKF